MRVLRPLPEIHFSLESTGNLLGHALKSEFIVEGKEVHFPVQKKIVRVFYFRLTPRENGCSSGLIRWFFRGGLL